MDETSYRIVLESLQFRQPSRVPVIPIIGLYSINFSGYLAHELLHDAAKQAESQLKCQAKFGYDGIFNIMDLSLEAQALGAEVEFPLNSFPYVKKHPLKDATEFKELPDLDVQSTRLSVFTDTISLLVQNLKEKVYISSYVIGPFTLAGHLLGIDKLMELTVEDSEITDSLVSHCAKVVEPYIEAQIEAGTDNIVILEPSASSSLISPAFFKLFCFQNVKALVSRIHGLGVGATLHICGKSSRILEMMCETGADVISIDSPVSLPEAKRALYHRACLMGNVDTSLLTTGTSEDIKSEATRCLDAAGSDGGFILSTSCDTPIEVPEENMAALVNSANAGF